METLNIQEINEVGGAKINVETAMATTLALMALGPGSAVVIGVGAVALITYAWMR